MLVAKQSVPGTDMIHVHNEQEKVLHCVADIVLFTSRSHRGRSLQARKNQTGTSDTAFQPRSRHFISTALAQAVEFSTLTGCNSNDKSV